MNNQQIIKILDAHSIPYKIEDGHVIADSMLADADLFEETVDVTGWTKKQLLDWLGY